MMYTRKSVPLSERNAVREFKTSLKSHIEAVQEAGAKLGVDSAQLYTHDLSKYSNEEFMGYALHFHGGGAPDKFARAWLHHIHYNAHHSLHWIFPDGHTPKDSEVVNGLVRMPERYALEMVADWMGASKTYTGDWDMTEWLTGHIPKIRVHPKTADFLVEILDGLGYADIVHLISFKTE